MSDKDRIPAEVFILFKLEGLKTALSDSPVNNILKDSFPLYHSKSQVYLPVTKIPDTDSEIIKNMIH